MSDAALMRLLEDSGVPMGAREVTRSPEMAARRVLRPERWRWAGEHDGGRWLSERPEPAPMLLTMLEDGAPILPLGRVGMLAAGGGMGKSWALVQLALSVATGRPWLETFRVERPGRVLLALAEEQLSEIRRRLYFAAEAMDLDAKARAAALERILPLGLAGAAVRLTHASGEVAYTPEMETDFARELTARIREVDEWSLLILDPLARFAGADAETDNAAATRFVEALERLTEAPGRPTVLAAHHTVKSSRQGATDASAARGSSGLTDGIRWQAALDPIPSAENPRLPLRDCLELRITKTNYAAPLDEDLFLIRDRERHGALRPASPSERADIEGRRARPGRARLAENGPDKLRAAAAAAVAVVRTAGRPMSQNEIEAAMTLKAAAKLKRAGIDHAVGMGALRREPGARRAVMHVFARDLEEEA